MNKCTIIPLITTIYFLLSCSPDPNLKANNLYVEANMILKSIAIDDSYTDTLKKYKIAKKNIDYIISAFASSDIAASLIANKTKVSGYTLNEFNKLENYIVRFVEAEKDIISCASVIAEKIDDPYFKILTYTQIADHYLSGGNVSQYEYIFNNILRYDMINNLYHVDVFQDIIRTFSNDKYYKELFNIENNIGKIFHNLSIHDKISIYYYLYSFLEDHSQREQVLLLAYETIKAIDDKITKNVYLKGFAFEYSKINKREESNKILDEVLEFYITLGDEFSVSLIADLAINYATEGNNTESNRLLSIANDNVNKIKYDYSKSSSLAELAGTYIDLNQKEKGIELLKRSEIIANNIDSGILKDSTLLDISNIYIKLLDFNKAIEKHKDINSNRYKTELFVAVADGYLKNDLKNDSIAILSRALNTSSLIEDEIDKISNLINIANIYINAEEIEQAKNILSQILNHTKYVEIETQTSLMAYTRDIDELLKLCFTLEMYDQGLKVIEQVSTNNILKNIVNFQDIYEYHSNLKYMNIATKIVEDVFEDVNIKSINSLLNIENNNIKYYSCVNVLLIYSKSINTEEKSDILQKFIGKVYPNNLFIN